ncbi:E3 ubiquitin-protein ligase ATL42-like [Impatiens glandulifera]|uniref:E3 ubiquitin-protein ligase ATL42-like n=1 Tax=Impatiens glandulifera TaxID=253017 RepID=UPI001FB0B097|nr:E3 ubiquitin-protein ligase ATL42-like [Impatiens glandulifera]
MLIFFFNAAAVAVAEEQSSNDSVTNFTPSLAIVLAILSIVFALTFILLVYLKFCYISGASVHDDDQESRTGPGHLRSGSRFSGIDKNVVDSLPFFRFSSLKGSREGLECAVCLFKFEDVEILRLLPKCKHGFHIDCIDEWLGQHSTCPLCRQRVTLDDLNNFLSGSFRWPSAAESMDVDSSVELFVERERDEAGLNSSSSRFSIGGSFRKMKEMYRRNQEHDQQVVLHRVNHKISTVSDHLFVLKNRWSNVSSSDLLFLNKEMLRSMSSSRFSAVEDRNEKKFAVKIKDEMERGWESETNKLGLVNLSCHTSRILIQDGQRSRSEIAVHPRLIDFPMRNCNRGSSPPPAAAEIGSVRREERMRMNWLSIARTTVRWFANRERFQPRV